MPCTCGAEDHPELLRKPYEESIPKDCWLFQNSQWHRRQMGGAPLEQIVVPTVEYPSAAQMVANATTAVAEWIEAGRPIRDEAEQKRIHLICESCVPFYDKEQDRCKVCGCGLSKDSSVAWMKFIGVPDAIKMATKHCPLPEPKW